MHGRGLRHLDVRDRLQENSRRTFERAGARVNIVSVMEELPIPDQPGPDATGAYLPDSPLPPVAERFTPGTLLAERYRIVVPLGKGGMGEVYRADDLTLGQSVALKFLPEGLAHHPDRLARFHQELRIARQVSHPNVCRVFDIGKHEGQPFLTMEYIDGQDLAGLLKQVGHLPEEKGIEIARQLCLGLAAAHDQRVLHRDLKPANVLLDGRGQVRITDFGLAGFVENLQEVNLREGTPAYMAPEQLAGKEVSVGSDLFALGLLLYELFTGKKAFPAKTPVELRRLYEEATPSKPSSHVSGMNAAVERVILRCLEKDPKDRPKSAYEVLAGLPGGRPTGRHAVAAERDPVLPRLVADAGGEGAIRPWVGLVMLGVVVASIVLVALLADRTMLFRKVPLPEPPEFLGAARSAASPGALRATRTRRRTRPTTSYRTRNTCSASCTKMRRPGRWDRLAHKASCGSLLLLPAESPTARAHGHRIGRHTRLPRYGVQSAADAAGDGGHPPGSERLAFAPLRCAGAVVGGAADSRRLGLEPLVRPGDDRLRPGEGSDGNSAAVDAALRLRSASGLERYPSRLPRRSGAGRGGGLPRPSRLFSGHARLAGPGSSLPASSIRFRPNGPVLLGPPGDRGASHP